MIPRRVLLVGDPWHRGMLAAVRSLATSGHQPSVAATEPGHAGTSRCRVGFWAVPSSADSAFGEAVARAVRESGAEVVLGADDEHMAVLSSRPALALPAVVGHPDATTVASMLDKAQLRSIASAVGMAVPTESIQAPIEDPERWIAKRRTYIDGDSPQHLLASTLQRRAAGWDDGGWIFQRVLEGPLVAVVLLADREGTILYTAAQRAERVYPRPFGVSTRAVSFPLPSQWRVQVQDLINTLGWWGLAELQFICPPGGEPHLIDFNGRAFGSMALTLARGIDLPGATVALALNDPLPDLTPTSGHRRYQWLEGDLRQAMASSARLRELTSVARAAPRSVHSLWDRRDPWPATRHGVELGTRAARKLRAKVPGLNSVGPTS